MRTIFLVALFIGASLSPALLAAKTLPFHHGESKFIDDDVYHFKAGEEIPFVLVLKSDFAKVHKKKAKNITLDQDVWIQKKGSGIFASFDGKSFKSFSDVFEGKITAKMFAQDSSEVPGIKIVVQVDRAEEK